MATTRISKRKRRHMTKHLMAHLHGKTSVAPIAQVHHVHKPSVGAGRLGATLITNHATMHHNRRTVPVLTPIAKPIARHSSSVRKIPETHPCGGFVTTDHVPEPGFVRRTATKFGKVLRNPVSRVDSDED